MDNDTPLHYLAQCSDDALVRARLVFRSLLNFKAVSSDELLGCYLSRAAWHSNALFQLHLTHLRAYYAHLVEHCFTP